MELINRTQFHSITITMPITTTSLIDMVAWIADNFESGEYYMDSLDISLENYGTNHIYVIVYKFKNIDDAMAFKLRWA
jgi:hypothetical protein